MKVICPICFAAVGFNCMRRVKDGHQQLEDYHLARLRLEYLVRSLNLKCDTLDQTQVLHALIEKLRDE